MPMITTEGAAISVKTSELLQRVEEIIAGDDALVVLEADERLAREQDHHLVQRGPERVADRVDRHQDHRQQRRQQPQARESVAWST